MYDAVLLPLASVPAATGAAEVMLVAPAAGGGHRAGAGARGAGGDETPVETESAPSTNVVEAADTTQPAVLPRVSLTPTVPREPETEAAPGAPSVSAALAAAVTSRLPPASVKVAAVSPVSAAGADPWG